MILMAPVPDGGYTKILRECVFQYKYYTLLMTYSSSGSIDGDLREDGCRVERRTGSEISVMLPLAPLL